MNRQTHPHWFQPGQSGNPKGRPKGETYTRQEVARICKERNFHPIHALIDIAQDPKSSGYLKMECAKELCSYLISKLRTVQLSDNEGTGPAKLVISWDDSPTKSTNNLANNLAWEHDISWDQDAAIAKAIVEVADDLP